MHADSALIPALEVVKATDFPTYARMAASTWKAYAIYTGDEKAIDDLAAERGPWGALALVANLSDAFGVTLSERNGTPLMLTYINVPLTVEKARDLRVPPADFAADVLVHEFAHTGDGKRSAGEPEAFDAGTVFAHKLPSPYRHAIARLSEESRAAFA